MEYFRKAQDVELDPVTAQHVKEENDFIAKSLREANEKPTPCQEAALKIIQDSHDNVFISGGAGVGKSYLINQIKKKLGFPVVTPTGISALLVGGDTIHRVFGLGLFDGDVERAVAKALGSTYVREFFRYTRGIIIDEISMVSGSLFTAMEEIARKARGKNLPWGGMRVITVGDFRQLPPVEKGRDPSRPRDWAFHSPAWQESWFRPAILRTVVRQSNDAYAGFLNRARCGLGNMTPADFEFLKSRAYDASKGECKSVHLFTTNAAVDDFNQNRLRELDASTLTINTHYVGDPWCTGLLKKGVPAGDLLQLKIGSRVMIRVNNWDLGIVNGMVGTLVDTACEFDEDHVPDYLDGFPMPPTTHLVIDVDGHGQVRVPRHVWKHEAEGMVHGRWQKMTASAAQFPVCLAWAFTIHKSQGCTMDAAYVDLSRADTPGASYVALSRVKNPDGLHIGGWSRLSFPRDHDVTRFYQKVLEAVT